MNRSDGAVGPAGVEGTARSDVKKPVPIVTGDEVVDLVLHKAGQQLDDRARNAEPEDVTALVQEITGARPPHRDRSDTTQWHGAGPWLVAFGIGRTSAYLARKIHKQCAARGVAADLLPIDEIGEQELQLAHYLGLVVVLPSEAMTDARTDLRSFKRLIVDYRSRRPSGLGSLRAGSSEWSRVGVVQVAGIRTSLQHPWTQNLVREAVVCVVHSIDDAEPDIDVFEPYAAGFGSAVGAMRTSRELAAHLRWQIRSGTLGPGDQLPTGVELRDQYGVAKQSVYAAVKILRDEGLVRTRPGVGCFVRDDMPHVRLMRRPIATSHLASGDPLLLSFTTADADQWLSDATATRRIVTAGAELGAELGVDADEQVLLRVRAMTDNGEVVALVTSCFPRSITSGTIIESEDVGSGGVFARLKDLGFLATRHIERVGTGLTTEAEAAQLDCGPALSSVLRITRLTLADDGRVLGVIQIVALAERFELLYENFGRRIMERSRLESHEQ